MEVLRVRVLCCALLCASAGERERDQRVRETAFACHLYVSLRLLNIKLTECMVGHEGYHSSSEAESSVETDKSVVMAAWTEINVLRGCVHDNILAYYDHFVVLEDQQTTDKMGIVMLLEYASAGHLEREIERHPGERMDEPGARYYAMQIIRGLAYLHRKFVVHGDLHGQNVLLRYNSNGSKNAMIADFGHAFIYDPVKVAYGYESFDTRSDVDNVVTLIRQMIAFKHNDNEHVFSREVKHLILAFMSLSIEHSRDPAMDLEELLRRFAWFHAGPCQVPFLS